MQYLHSQWRVVSFSIYKIILLWLHLAMTQWGISRTKLQVTSGIALIDA
ncbi:hypothetical protein [Helicobacter rodentium]|nr:hypothetical protein [Helicobacter rodentium]